MDILDLFWTFHLNHLSPLWGYFWEILEKSYVKLAGGWLVLPPVGNPGSALITLNILMVLLDILLNILINS